MATQFEGKDIIDSRDIQVQIDELKEIADAINDKIRDEESRATDEEELEELKSLISFKKEVESNEWMYELAFIRDSYFEDYARQIAEDIGAIADDSQWPVNCIDWEKAAEELKMDYSAAELDGDTYYYLFYQA